MAVGLLIGAIAARSEPAPAESVPLMKATLLAAAASLEVASVEYRESVQHGRVVNPTEYDGSLSALRSSRANYDEVRSALVSLFPLQVEAIDVLYGDIEEMMTSKVAPPKVDAALKELEELLAGRRPESDP